MKKLFCLLLVLASFTVCKKNSTAPATAPPPISNNNANNNLSQQEQALVGYWIMDSMVVYVNGIRVHGNNQVYTNTVTCMMNFKTDWFHSNNGGGTNEMKMVDGHNSCVPSEIYWKAPNQGSVYIGSILYGINQLTTNSLQFDYGPPSGLLKYYFHK